jgi:hypothetical protein
VFDRRLSSDPGCHLFRVCSLLLGVPGRWQGCRLCGGRSGGRPGDVGARDRCHRHRRHNGNHGRRGRFHAGQQVGRRSQVQGCAPRAIPSSQWKSAWAARSDAALCTVVDREAPSALVSGVIHHLQVCLSACASRMHPPPPGRLTLARVVWNHRGGCARHRSPGGRA